MYIINQRSLFIKTKVELTGDFVLFVMLMLVPVVSIGCDINCFTICCEYAWIGFIKKAENQNGRCTDSLWPVSSWCFYYYFFFVSSVENNNCDVRQNSGCLLLPFITNRWTLDSVHGAKRFNQACTIFLFVLTLSLVLSFSPPI